LSATIPAEPTFEARRQTSAPGRPLRIGTRGSPMALRQTALVRDRLIAAHPGLGAAGAVEIVTIRTTGDRVQDRLLAEIGGKGLFTKEIEQALILDAIDLAVHSLKDMETWLPDGLEIGCVLARDDPRDALLSRSAASLASLPAGARIGTASLRRQAQLLRRRPDLSVIPIRGNVNTRLDKLAAGEFEAIVLALCGLERLGKAGLASEILAPEIMLPAVGQGALAIECRAGDEELQQLLAPLHDAGAAACVRAERAMLAALDGSCRTPIAGLAELAGDRLTIEGLLLQPDGSGEVRGRSSGDVGDAAALGAALGGELRARAGPGFGFC
jgi:hydroxymethylbilane synthase